MFRAILALLALALSGCSFSPIEDGARYGDVVVVADLFTSCAVLEHTEGVVLFDACFRPGRLEGALEGMGHSPADVTDVFLTHGHGDHVAGIALLPGATVHALSGEASLVEEEAGRAPDSLLEAGDIVPIGGHLIEVFSVPGHTDGSAVYLVGGVLVLGDAAFADRDGRLIDTPPGYSDDPEQLAASLREVARELHPRASEVEWLLPAHTGGIAGVQALFDY